MNYLIVYHLKVNLFEEEERDVLQCLISKTTRKTIYTRARARAHTQSHPALLRVGKGMTLIFPSLCPPNPELALTIFLPRKIQGV